LSRRSAIDPTTLDTVGRDHSELWMVPVAGGASRKLDIDVDAWHRGSSEWFGAGFSLAPDGKRIAFLTQVQRRSLGARALPAAASTRP
jgi:hypothetical protein